MKYVIANWKMNLTARESVALVRGVLRSMQGREVAPEIVLCPSFTALSEAQKLVTRTRVQLGAQNVGPDRAGAYTGEVGIAQLEDVGCTYVIIGHSERRQRLAENDALVRERLAAVLASDLVPIVCVGEPAEARDAGQAEVHVLQQLKQAFANLAIPRDKRVLVAYEPIWAIGSGNPATPQDAIAMHNVIREYLTNDMHLRAENFAVVYGGSVDGENAYAFLREPEIEGVLVGGASLKIHDFEKILAAACEVIEAQESV